MTRRRHLPGSRWPRRQLRHRRRREQRLRGRLPQHRGRRLHSAFRRHHAHGIIWPRGPLRHGRRRGQHRRGLLLRLCRRHLRGVLRHRHVHGACVTCSDAFTGTAAKCEGHRLHGRQRGGGWEPGGQCICKHDPCAKCPDGFTCEAGERDAAHIDAYSENGSPLSPSGRLEGSGSSGQPGGDRGGRPWHRGRGARQCEGKSLRGGLRRE